ncbi:MAG: cpdA 2, partial [Verrucomicrobiaceae bacterium]|nr:cpdA 2 [Verrucomicrobiaceae bacterium]
MPITLPALTRRQLLQRGASVGLGMLAGQHLALAEESKKELWLLFSDTHIAEDRTHIEREVNMAEHLQQAVKEVLRLQEKERAYGLFVNGDLALKDGQQGDYAAFVDIMRPLRTAGIDLHLTMGNHDDRQKFWDGCEELAQNKKLMPLKQLDVITSALVNWVLLDSLQETNHTPGEVGESQLGWLDRTLRDLPEKPTVVMVHHNPQFPAGEGAKHTGLIDTEAFVRVLDKHSKAKAVIYGHTHNWEVKTKNSGHHY